MSEPWLKKSEVAAELRVSVSTVERHIAPTEVVGGQNRYLMSDVRRQLRAAREGNVVELRPKVAA